MTEKLIVIGTGPAGLTASLYAARGELKPLCLEGHQPGGQLTITTEVENFPAFPDGITGPELVTRMHDQCEKFGTRFMHENAVSVDLSKRPFTVVTETASLTTEALIIASGASARWLGIESERKLMGHGVSACATCDAFFFRGKEVVVIGGGDSAMEEATFLTKFATKVTVVHRRDALRASKIMQERALRNGKIQFIWDSAVEEIYHPEQLKVTGVRLRNLKTNATSDYPCDGVFLAIGHDPNTRFLNRQVQMNPEGFILTFDRTTATSVPGVFACGDVMDPRYKQAITAAGTGCAAAIDAERWLGEQEQ